MVFTEKNLKIMNIPLKSEWLATLLEPPVPQFANRDKEEQ
jgi:hypothetical protein